MSTDAVKCLDCGGTLSEIKLIDKGHHSQHNDLEYAAADAKRGYWLGRFAIAGRVRSIMCQQCGRINLYGVPNE